MQTTTQSFVIHNTTLTFTYQLLVLMLRFLVSKADVGYGTSKIEIHDFN